eukprot:TRINITY_DN471_c0_g1_i2.p1 TRINITY_DN471_c0_g1~~TRINITY_DN471_c0_g1_i2.p1  ORF type:complete len:142 (-),score=28.42 TRINITY_DN471_c0_g1_i2:33-458(-)
MNKHQDNVQLVEYLSQLNYDKEAEIHGLELVQPPADLFSSPLSESIKNLSINEETNKNKVKSLMEEVKQKDQTIEDIRNQIHEKDKLLAQLRLDLESASANVDKTPFAGISQQVMNSIATSFSETNFYQPLDDKSLNFKFA